MNSKLVQAFLSLCLSAVLVLSAVSGLRAHAILVEATPKGGTTVTGPDIPIRLRFNVRVDGQRSRLMLVPPAGLAKQLTLDKQALADVLTTKAVGLASGKYKVQWQVLAADGHISRGELAFAVQ